MSNPFIPPKRPSVTPQRVAKHFDIVLGFDFHMLKVPWPFTPCPVTPFAALVFDPLDYIHITLPPMPVFESNDDGLSGVSIQRPQMGGNLTINGFYKATATTGLMGIPPTMPPIPSRYATAAAVAKKLSFLHAVLPKTLFLFYNPAPGLFSLVPHDGQVSHGSETVFNFGKYELSAEMCNVWSCNELGSLVLNNPTSLFANYATKIIAVLPIGKPVMVGGPFKEHEFTIADLLNSLMFMGIMRLGRRILSWLLTKLNQRLFRNNPRLRDSIQDRICRFLGEPVDPASGNMTTLIEGFNLPGPIPLIWEANYYSNSDYDGPLGKNIYHSYDIALKADESEDFIMINDASGRPIPFPTLKPGNSFFNSMEKFELYRSPEGEYYVSNSEGLYYYFTKEKDKNGWHHLRTIANRNGFAIRFNYSPAGHLIEIVDSAHRHIKISNDETGRITELQLPHPELKDKFFSAVRYEYDTDGRMVVFYDARSYSNRLDWNKRLITARKFKDGTVFNFEFDASTRCIAALGPNGLYSYRFIYKEGHTIVENSLGNKSLYYYQKGIVTRVVNSQGGEKIYSYDYFNNLIGEQDEIGNVKSFSYDKRGNLVDIGLPSQGNVKIEYNQMHLPEKIIQPNDGIWQYEYDSEGNLIKRVNPVGAVTFYSYTNGLLSQITNTVGSTTHLYYDYAYNLKEVMLPNKSKISFDYDKLGRCIDIMNAFNNHQVRNYDMVGNIIRVQEPDGNICNIEYDADNNPTRVYDIHNDIQFKYNFFGDITLRNWRGATIKFLYDTEGQLVRVHNEHGDICRFELDSEGQIIREIGFDGLTRQYERNARGQLTTMYHSNGKKTIYQYDTASRITLIKYADDCTEEFNYDTLGNIVKAKNAETEIVFERDLMGRVISEKQDTYVVMSTFDLLGNRTNIHSNMGAEIQFTYDNLMSWTEVISANGWRANIKRNQQGLELLRSMNGGVNQRWQYDTIGRPLLQNVMQGAETKRSRQYTWSENNRLTSLRDSHEGTKRFVHDAYGNLAEVIYGDGTIEYRVPDVAGNLFRSADHTDRNYDKCNKLIKSNGKNYEYDSEGNLIKKIEKNHSKWNYIWNANGTLQKVIRPDGIEVSFGYDALRRRIWKRIKNTITRWVWDGSILLHEWKEFDVKESNPDELITWVFESKSFIPAAKIKGNKKYSIITDHIGTPYQLYDENGKTTWNSSLDSYGKRKVEKGEIGSCPFRYQGQYEDLETGLYYNRFRYYLPEEGIYISLDPIGLLSGSTNFYTYVSDTNYWVDVFGLQQGGSHRNVRAANTGGQVHHTPSYQSYRDVSDTPSHGQGPSIHMDTEDHYGTESHGSYQNEERDAIAYRARQEQLIRQGNWAAAVEMDIGDIQLKFGNRYNAALREMIDYTFSIGRITQDERRRLRRKCR